MCPRPSAAANEVKITDLKDNLDVSRLQQVIAADEARLTEYRRALAFLTPQKSVPTKRPPF
jgi:hypothetical protein